MSGPPPKPTALRIIDGSRLTNPKKRKREPQPIGEMPGPPADMSDTERELWALTAAGVPPGLLASLDWSVFEIYIRAWALYRTAAAAVALEGAVFTTDAGNKIQHPYLSVQNKQALIMLKAGAEMGFTPAARTRVTIAEPEKTAPSKAASYFKD